MNPTPDPFTQLLRSVVEQIVDERTASLKAELALIKSLQDEWVGTKEALRITGLKQAQTLKVERERPNTLLVVKFGGKAEKTPLYLRTSLLAYSESKTSRRHVPTDLAA